MKYLKGIIGIAILGLGIFMAFYEQTQNVSWVIIGFGLGMITSGFQGD